MLLYDKDDNNDDIDDNNDENAMVWVRNPLRMREPGPSTSLSEYKPSHDDDDDCHGCSPFYLRPFYLPSLLPTGSR